MKKFILAPLALLVVVAGASGRGADVHPVVNVIELLKTLKTQVVEHGRAEEVTYSKFAQWCSDSKRTLSKAIKASEDTIDQLKSEIEADKEENATLTREIAALTADIDKFTQSGSEAETQRTKENELYTAADADFASSIDAFNTVITALQDAKTQADSASLLQSFVGRLPVAAFGLASLSPGQAAFLEELNGTEPRPDLLAKGDYGAHTKKYTFRSGNVLELMKDLKMTFEDQRVEATKGETNAVNAYNLAKDAREKAILAATTARSTKQSALQSCAQRLTTAQSSLDDAEGDLTADKGTLSTTTRDCDMKQSEWEERSSVRAREEAAMVQAIKILGKVAGVRTEKPENPVLPVAPAADAGDVFLQLPEEPQGQALNLLKTEATRLHSKSFMRFAEELAGKLSGAGPFSEVSNMIQKMIFRLMAEQKDEDDHKNWCDLELSKTNSSMENKGNFLTEVDLKLTSAKADVSELTQKITEGNDMLSTIATFMQEATEVRKVGKKENQAAIKDAKDASMALAKAIAILQDFYKETGMVAKEAWEFVQKGAEPVTLPSNPATWDQAYTGVADPKNPQGIIAVLEQVASGFSTMEAESKAQEATDEKNYQDVMKAQEIEKARRTKDVEMKEQEVARLKDHIASMEKSKKRTESEKEALEQYLADLEPACVTGDSTYEERKQARTDEIDALKEAQVILADTGSNETAANTGAFLAQVRSVRHV